MSSSTNPNGSTKSRRNRVIKMAPMTRAVRVALAASLAALALGASGGAFAADCKAPNTIMAACAPAAADLSPVLDLTLVHGPAAPAAFIMPLAIDESAFGDVVVDNDDPIFELGLGRVIDISVVSYGGDAVVNNGAGGNLEANSTGGLAGGIFAHAYGGDASVNNSGNIDAQSDVIARGITAIADGSAYVANDGAVFAYGSEYAGTGILASGFDDAYVYNSGQVFAGSKYGTATGISVDTVSGDAGINNTGIVQAQSYTGDAVGLYGYTFAGSVSIDNEGDLLAVSINGNATGAMGYSDRGSVDVQNFGDITAISIYGTAVGVYGYSYDGDVSIGNDGTVYAGSKYGIADGMFASGVNAEASNSGDISAVNIYGGWAAGIEAQADDLATVDNSGYIYASASYGSAFGIYASGDMVDVTNSGGINAQGYYATGIDAQGGSSAMVTNDGDINAGSLQFATYYYSYGGYDYSYTYLAGGAAVATGINASAGYPGGQASVTNSGDISAVSIYGSTGIAATATATGGTASVNNSGSVYAYQYNKYGYGSNGIVASADGDASIENTSTGSITVVSNGAANGATALSFAGNASVTNAGDISVDSTAALYYGAYGIVSFAQNGDAYVGNSGNVSATGKYLAAAVDAAGYGDVTVDNSGSLSADGSKYAFGVRAYSGAGDVMVDNREGGSIEAYSYLGSSFGVLGVAYQGDVGVNNAGSIYAYGYGQTVGVFGLAFEGDTTVTNSGDITAITGGDVAVGIVARSDYGTSTVDNSGDIVASTDGVNGFTGYAAFGILASGEYVDVDNSGSIDVTGFLEATGISAQSYYGTTVSNSGGIYAYAVGQATGINATSFFGDVSVDNSGSIDAIGLYYGATGISATTYGDVHVDNSGDIFAYSYYGDATGINAYSVYGTADIQNSNSGNATAFSFYGSAIGLYGYSYAGDVSIGNDAYVTAVSFYGLADGIFASGVNTDVSNSGDITALSLYGNWAAGIEAEGVDTTTVDNSGNIYASAGYGAAYGIYASGDVIEIGNSGNIEAQGYYATGIEAQGGSAVTITNDGSIVAGSSYYSAVGTGINATSNYEGGNITITNNGDVAGMGYYGGTGIAATATGTGGTASITNNGSIYASQYSVNGYGAYGMIASADGDATVDNTATGSIIAYSGGGATGAAALSFAGNASATNAGEISVTAFYGDAYGIVSFAQNGSAYAGNSGHIDVFSLYTGVGIEAGSLQGTTVDNSGDIVADAWIAYGIRASSGFGDVAVDNSGSIYATYSVPYYSGTAFGIFASSTQGDVSVDNSGYIYTSVTGQSVGIFGISSYGDVDVNNSGDIASYTYFSTAAGIFARADYGTASVDNSGSIIADAYYGTAFGILARGEYVNVDNSGDISAVGFYGATGIAASSYYGSMVNNSGSISAYALGAATGIDATSFYGDVSVDNSGSIDAVGIYYGGTGVSATAYGDAHVDNSGDIFSYSSYGPAIGIYALGGGSSVDNSGSITAVAVGDVARATGVINVATYLGDAVTTNSGDIEAFAIGGTAPYGVEESLAVGIYNLAVFYDSVVDNSGYVSATALAMDAPVDLSSFFTTKAIGVQAVNIYGLGEASINNTGEIYSTSATTQGFASAWGAVAQGLGLYGDAGISNDGLISTYGYADIGTANSIAAYASAMGGDVSVVNHGDILSVAHSERGVIYYAVDYSYATGVKLLSPAYYGAGSATLENYGSIEAVAFSEGGITGARGVQAYGAHTTINNHEGATISATGEVGSFGGGFASGIEAGGKYGVDIVNDGDIEVHGIGHGEASGPHTYYAASRAVGVEARANYQGDATVVNSGDINAIAMSDLGVVGAYGAQVHGKYTGNLVNEAGASIVAYASVGSLSTDAYGGRAVAFGTHMYGTDYGVITNSGHMSAQAIVEADGGPNDSLSLASVWGASIGAYSTSQTGTVVNHGDIQVLASADFGAAKSYGTFVNSQYMADTSNTGLISSIASADGGDAFAVGSYSNALHSIYYVPCDEYGCDYSNATFTADDGIAKLTNSGDIIASASAVGGVGSSYAAVVRGAFGSSLTNAGHIMAATEADDAQATGALLVSFYGASSMQNSGLIQAVAEGDHASATGAGVIGLGGNGVNVTNKLVNSGSITSIGDGDRIAISSEGNAKADLLNSGTIIGAINTGDLDDKFVNASGGKWYPIGASYFGGGNDSIVNSAGGLIWMSDAAIHMGAGSDNITNLGVIKISGNNLIDMGAGNVGAFTNVQLVDFFDGHTDDKLSITGNFGGTGALGLDVDLPSLSSDQVFVQGNMVANAAQHVDILFEGMPTTAHTSIDFARVTGTSVAGSFVPGQILGYNYPRNFIDLQFSIGSNINTANTAADVFSINLDVAGLLDSGTIAANIASGAAGMLNAQIGTFRQRMGVNPYGDAGKVMSAFFRTYTSEGDVSPDHVAANFGQGGNFDYDLSTWGREVGVNANLFGNFHAGVALGSADGRQRLTGAGMASNRMDGMTWAAYATWFAPQGYYIDLSGRWMAVDVRTTSPAGNHEARAHTSAANLEAGYNWTTASGFTITPQLQYTRTSVEDVTTLQGDRADFEGHGGTSERGRLGVEFSKTFQSSSGVKYTPYASINAIREFDGEMTYTVADNFFGATSTEGTSSMAELGIGIQKNGFAVSAGANWVDGGAFKSEVGGQVIVRFAW